jgi:2-methylcitrate dehydratase PrpD
VRPQPPTAAPPAAPLAARLAAFAVGPVGAGVPAAVRGRARLHLLDVLGCGLAAVGLDAGSAAAAVATAQGGAAEAAVLGGPGRLPAALAALANGTRCHALDFDDTHERGICHSSAVVAPAALAAGQAAGASGDELLAAYLLGGEVALRIAVVAADGLYARGLHPTSVCGVFGASAAAARLLGLDAEQAANALGIAGSFAGGLFEYLSDGSATKPLHAGWAAHAGIQAARLAAAGATGPATVIEGRFGLLRSHAGDCADVEAMADRLGERWEVLELAIKPYPACHFAHASTWAAAELLEESGVRLAEIEEIAVRVPEEGAALVLEPLAAKHAPRTPYDAKFSLPYTVAFRLVHGHLDLGSFAEDRIRDPAVLALAARVRPEPLAGPAPSRFAGGVRLRTASGAELDRFLAATPGSPGNPLDERDVVAKFRANAALALAGSEVDELEALLGDVERLASLDRLGELLSAARSRAP